MIYLLDSNVIVDLLNGKLDANRFDEEVRSGHQLILCRPVYFEVIRGLLKAQASTKIKIFQSFIVESLNWVELEPADWERAAQLWADTRSAGRMLSDTDLLIAALTLRMNAVLITADADFDALPVQRQNWRR